MMQTTPEVSRLRWMLPLILLLILTLAACGKQQREAPQEPATPAAAATTTTAVEAPATAAATPEPSATTVGESPLAAPNTSPLAAPNTSPLDLPNTSPLATPVAHLETAPGTGVVTGVLLVRTETGEVPVEGENVGLGSVLTNEKGQEAVVRYTPQTRDDMQTSPKTITEESGFFAFRDVPPGRYGLVLDAVLKIILLPRPGLNEDLFFTVEAGQQIDLGPLVYDDLPVSGSSQ